MGKRRRGKRRQRQPTTSTAAATEAAAAAVQPNLHENMDEVHLHDQGKVVFVDTKIKSAKFTPLSLVMNNGGPDPPEENNSDSDEAGEDDENYREDPREDFSDMETSNNQQQYINSLEEPDSSDSDFCSSSSDEEENIQFFQPSNNFNYATDKPTILHKEGDCFGVDYLKTRAERKAKERQHRFEIEAWQEQRRHQGKWRWCWEGEDDEFDDVDFLDYQESIKRRTLMTNVVIFFVSFFVCTAILEHQMHFLSGRSSSSSLKHNTATSLHHDSNGMNASSRWGHRFDDDALDGDDIVFDTNFGNNPKYHSHNRHHNDNLSPEEEMEDLEKWEEYEMDTANVLANSAQGWDIHSKSGGLEQDSDKEREDDENDHWVQYFDKSSQQYYYFHKETNTTTWTKPDIVKGVVLLGVTRSGTEYIVEEFKDDEDSDVEVAGDTSDEAIVEEEEAEESDASTLALSNFEPQTILEHYSDTYWRWNHPYRIPERTEIWGGIDTPVFWHIPNSGTTTAEEIFEHCYHMVIAGTTGSSNDGKIMKQRNVTDHLSVYTLEDGSHYLNIDLRTPHGISLARTAGLGQSGVADVILTRYIFNAADLFRDTGHTGRCFTLMRHPVDRIISRFHALKGSNAPEVKDMTLEAYARSEVVDQNWMVRMLTNTTDDQAVTPAHYQVAKEVFGRKCLIGLTNHYEDSIDRFAKFFQFESTHSINTRNKGDTANFVEERRTCMHKLAASGVNRHKYPKLSHDSATWKELERKNKYDIELYDYAAAMYYQQSVVYEDMK